MSARFRITDDGSYYFEEPDCRLKCLHCSHGVKKRLCESKPVHKMFAGAASLFQRLPGLSEFAALVAAQEGPVCLSGHDVLEAEEIFELLDTCRRHGRRIKIISPGLRLADPEFARAVTAYSPELLLTCLSGRENTAARMTGLPEARQLTDRALINLRDLGAGFGINFVATSDNCGELAEVAAYLFETIGLTTLTVLNFFPDWIHYVLDARTPERFARFERLNRQLRSITRAYAGSNRKLCLWGIPPCKLDDEVLTGGCLTFSVRDKWDPAYRVSRARGCSDCRFESKCFFISRYNHSARRNEYLDYQKVNRLYSSLVY